MTVKEFATSLAGSLIDRDINRDDAVNHVLKITKTLTEDDLKEITEYTSEEDFTELSDSLAAYIKKKKSLAECFTAVKETATAEEGSESGLSVPEYDEEDITAFTSGNDFSDTREVAADDEVQEIILGDDSAIMEKTKLTAKAKVIFWAVAVLSLPLTAVAAALLLGLFVLTVVTVCAFIVLTFALVLVEVAGGGVCFFVGLIYGIVKIVGGMPGTGLFEMGVGFVCLGITLVLSYLTYAFATKTLPYILKEVLAFWGTVVRRVGLLIGKFREECNRL